MTTTQAIAGMSPTAVRMSMTYLSRVQDVSGKEESLSFAAQVQELFSTRGGSFATAARQVLEKSAAE